MAPGAEIFSEWLRRQGYRVIQTPSTYWYEAMPRVYQAFPYHWQIHPTQAEVRGLLKQNRGIALRCSSSLSTGRGGISYHVVYDKPAYELDALDRRTRQNIRSGLKHCTVERVSLQRLAEEGWELEADTVRRQGRQFSMNQAAWRRKYLSAQGLEGFEAWGALVDGKLAASILLFQAESGVTELLSQQCHSRYLPKRANHALAFTVTRHLVNCGQKVFYTLQSLDARESVDEFKLRMGYSAKLVRQEVVFHPLLEPFVNKRTHRLLKWMSAHNRSWLPLAKAEGMVRFHLNGRCPTAVQSCRNASRARSIERRGMELQRFAMEKPNECQLPCLPTLSEGAAPMPPQPLLQTIKRLLAKPWNYHFKKLAKKLLPPRSNSAAGLAVSTGRPALRAGDWVRVRSRPEIVATLDRWNELKGCAFLEKMWPYCGTTQRVLQPMERFLDERDYQVKKCRGLVTLENVICRGTPVFGRCDRCCHFFWREEWLEKIEPSSAGEGEAAS